MATPTRDPENTEYTEDGCLRLVEAFWKEVHRDLWTGGSYGVVPWIEGRDKSRGQGFAFWCELCGQNPVAMRERFKRDYPNLPWRHVPEDGAS